MKYMIGGACGTYGGRRGAYRNLVGRPVGMRPFGRHKHRWEDIIQADLQKVGWGAWTGLIWLRIETDDGRL